MADIFLSYSRKDRGVAALLAGILPKYGWTLYWDRQLLAGEVFDDVLEREITAARCVVVLWSANSIASQWVRSEADEGASRNVMVSVRIEDVKVPLAFRRIQAADLIGWSGDPNDERVTDLVQAIAVLLSAHAEPAAMGAAAAASAGSVGGAAPAVSLPPAWPEGPPSEKWFGELKRELAEYVGPVASVVINRALVKSRNVQDLLQRISVEIPNEHDRDEFMRLRRSAARNPASRERETAAPPAFDASNSHHATEDETPEAVSAAIDGRHNGAASVPEGEFVPRGGSERAPSTATGSTRQTKLLWVAAAAAIVIAGAVWLMRGLPSRPSPIEFRVSPAELQWKIGKSDTTLASQIQVEGGPFAFEANSANTWIEVQPNRGTAPATVLVALRGNPVGIESKDGEVVIRRAGPGGEAKTIPVHLRVEAGSPTLTISPTALSLSSRDPVLHLNVTSASGPQIFSVRATKGEQWLTVMPVAGVTPAVLNVSYHNPPGVGLAVGSYAGELLCQSTNGQMVIPVSLTIQNAIAKTAAPVRMDAKAMDAVLIHKVVPAYPQLARAARVQGPVEFTAVIGKDGSIERLQLVRGHPLLVKAAEEAVEQFRYKPTLVKGEPVEVTTSIIINFVLTR